jgi:hypothetical protein
VDTISGTLPTVVVMVSLGESVPDLVDDMIRSNRYRFVEPNYIRLIEAAAADPLYPLQWSLDNQGTTVQYDGLVGADLNVACAWTQANGKDVVVAVLDEGVDLSHPDLIGNILPGYDAVHAGGVSPVNTMGGQEPGSDDMHGTACASIIAAVSWNGLGVSGIAPKAKILPVRIAYRSGLYWVTTDSWITAGIYWAVAQGADVISNSWGGGSSSTSINEAFAYAFSNGRSGKGAVVLAAAGNGNGSVQYPATLSELIAVGATSMCDTRKSPTSCDGEAWWGSDYGTHLDVMAPGVKIVAADLHGPEGAEDGDYILTFNGTSSACPAAAGVIALLLSADTSMTAAAARYYLESTCTKTGGYNYAEHPAQANGTWNAEMGYGRIDACAAMAIVGTELPGSDCASMCSSSGMTAADEWIESVRLGSLMRTSGADAGYADFGDSDLAVLVRGEDHALVLTPGFSGASYGEYWRVWLDLNRDGDFADAGEMIYDAGATSAVPLSDQVHIPLTADTGKARLRVQMKYNAMPLACESFMWGEVEDYCVTIADQMPACTTPNALTSLVHNLSSATVSWNALPEADSYVLRGRRQGTNAWRTVSMMGVSRTMHILKPGRTYEWTVAAKCGTASSSWAPVESFTMPTAKVGLTEVNFQLFPNPAFETAWIRLNNTNAGYGQLSVVDAAGRVYLDIPLTWDPGSPEWPLDLRDMSPGWYQIQLVTDQQVFGKTLLIASP